MEKLSFAQLKSLTAKAKQASEEKFREVSRKRLDKIISTKIRTTFIGAIAAVEEYMGFLWGSGKDPDDLTAEEAKISELWEQVRTRILNNGNTQLRAASNEIANHVISWNRYHTEFIIKKEDKDE